jgi:hypothetical protein
MLSRFGRERPWRTRVNPMYESSTKQMQTPGQTRWYGGSHIISTTGKYEEGLRPGGC